jgi:hypothetical protein
MQFEAALTLLFLLFLYGTMMMVTFDDDQEEFLEYFEQLFYTGVFYVFIYYVIRVGVHFFRFLKRQLLKVGLLVLLYLSLDEMR